MKDKNKDIHAETEPVLDERDVVSEADAQRVEEDSADNVADESFESGDNPSCEANQWQDKYLRLSAEFDNFRKRTLREKMDLISTGSEDVVKALLVVMDDIDRAVGYVDASDNIESARQGVALIHQKLLDLLQSKGVREIDAMGKEMDTDLFEAVAKLPADGEQKGKVVDVVQKGYILKDKVVRYAKVVVGE